MEETEEQRKLRLERGRKYDRGTRRQRPDYHEKQRKKQKMYRERQKEPRDDNDDCIIL